MARITRQQAKIDLTEIKGAKTFFAECNEILKNITDWNERLRIAQLASPKVIESARVLANSSFKNREVHYRYSSKYKAIKKKRAKKGFGNIVGEYYPGNLKRSIIDIAEKRAALRKGYNWKVVIGPFYAGRKQAKKSVIYNNEKNIDGYYAHMVYGSAKAFQRNIMIPALLIVRTAVTTIFRREAANALSKGAKKTSYIDFKKGF